MVPYFVIYLTSYFVTCMNHMAQEGSFVRETLALQAGTICSGKHRNACYTPVVDLCNNL
jgi:hypothetical protein